MAISTVSSVDELERGDHRFARKPNGRLKSNFSNRTDDPVERIRAHERYLEQMRQDGLNWRRQGDIAAAERAENQVAWEQADRESTHCSRARDRTSDVSIKERYNERMLEADSDCDLAEQRQFHSDTQHESRWHELHSQERQVREAQEQMAREHERLSADVKKPLRDRLQPDELAKYERDRQEYGRIMQRGRPGNFFDKPGESQIFDQRYSAHLLEMQESRLRAKDTRRERGEAPTAQKTVVTANAETQQPGHEPAQVRKAEQASPPEQANEMRAQAQGFGQAGKEELTDNPDEAPVVHPADGKEYAPLLKAHEGYRAQVSDDQRSIRYMREKDGSLGFTDRGGRVAVAPDAYKTDPEAMRAAMLHASEKFAKFKVSGNREHQEASARMAERLGIGDKVANPDLQDIVRQEREQIAREKTEQAIRDAKVRQQQGDSQAQQSLDGYSVPGGTVDSATLDERATQYDSRQLEEIQPLRALSEVSTTQCASRTSAETPKVEIMKPPGYDEREALAEATDQQMHEAQTEMARPPTEAPVAQSQRAHTQRAR